ncbi:hypothetical protein GLOIN_2v1770853 [Rhizophagus irregularis DAOM 181602=DAOM 197198]|nr:hypothetical protein GLOIN_2v1770853 [Rhizophagus irregularis DAOM 181602=DAOM 197198]
MDPKLFVDNDIDLKSFIDDETDESDRPDEPSDSLKLTSGLTFTDWEDFKVGYIGVMRRATYECTKSGSHNPQTTSDPTKQRNAHFQQTLCPWKLNVTRSKTGVVKVNSFNNEHNHPLILLIQEIAPRFQKLTKEMLADIENFDKNIIREMRMPSDALTIDGLEELGTALGCKDSIRSNFKEVDFSFMDVIYTKRVI